MCVKTIVCQSINFIGQSYLNKTFIASIIKGKKVEIIGRKQVKINEEKKEGIITEKKWK